MIQYEIRQNGVLLARIATGSSVILGTDPSCDIRMDATGLHPRHLQLRATDESLLVTALRGVPGADPAAGPSQVRSGTLKFAGIELTARPVETIDETEVETARQGWDEPGAVDLRPYRDLVGYALHIPGHGRVRIDGGQTILLGRAAPADVVVDHASLDDAHCTIQGDASGIRISDMGTCEGIWVDGKPFRHTVARAGAKIRIGTLECELKVIRRRGQDAHDAAARERQKRMDELFKDLSQYAPPMSQEPTEPRRR